MDRIDVTRNRNKTFTVSKKHNKSITLSRRAIHALKQHKNDILFDYKSGNGKERVYWESGNVKIFTKKSEPSNGTSGITNLWFTKNGNTIISDKDSFVKVLAKSLSSMRTERYSRFTPDHFYDLTIEKQVIVESKGNTWSIVFRIGDEEYRHRITFPLDALEKIVQKKDEIFADLQGNAGSKIIVYWRRDGCSIYTDQYRNFRALFFEPRFTRGTCIKDNTFQKLVDTLGDFFGEDELQDADLSEDESEKFGEELRINDAKSIQFSANKKECVITNRGDRIREIKLPISALDSLVDNRLNILADFNNGEAVPLEGQNYINEYWRNETHAIRTATFREIEKVLRFDGLRRKEFIISMQERAFLTLLNIYKQHKCK